MFFNTFQKSYNDFTELENCPLRCESLFLIGLLLNGVVFGNNITWDFINLIENHRLSEILLLIGKLDIEFESLSICFENLWLMFGLFLINLLNLMFSLKLLSLRFPGIKTKLLIKDRKTNFWSVHIYPLIIIK